MKNLTAMLVKATPITVLALVMEAVPEEVYRHLVENSMGPTPEHAIAFSLSFIALLVATGFSVKRLHKLHHRTVASV